MYVYNKINNIDMYFFSIFIFFRKNLKNAILEMNNPQFPLEIMKNTPPYPKSKNNLILKADN